jgi:hypothetical protein
MRHPRIIIASLALAALAAGGGITAASAASSPASSPAPAGQNAATAVRATRAAIGGKTETVLVNDAHGPQVPATATCCTPSLTITRSR